MGHPRLFLEPPRWTTLDATHCSLREKCRSAQPVSWYGVSFPHIHIRSVTQHSRLWFKIYCESNPSPHHLHPTTKFKQLSVLLDYQASSLMSVPMSTLSLPLSPLPNIDSDLLKMVIDAITTLLNSSNGHPPIQTQSQRVDLVNKATGSVPCLSLWLHLLSLSFSLTVPATLAFLLLFPQTWLVYSCTRLCPCCSCFL